MTRTDELIEARELLGALEREKLGNDGDRRFVEMPAQVRTGGEYECNVFDRGTLSSEAM
jgi:hypothetical protein